VLISGCIADIDDGVELTRKFCVWVVRYMRRNDENPDGTALRVKPRRDVVIRFGDEHGEDQTCVTDPKHPTDVCII
jgi:hypothetical protein